MPNLSSDNKLIFASYEKLLALNLVIITKIISPTEDGGATFNCKIQVPHPNIANIPNEVEVIVKIPNEYPLSAVSISVKDENLIGFPHQNVENGDLCLIPQEYAPINEDRLICYIKWAIEWFKDASNDNLLKPGDIYEIPSFNVKLGKELLLFQENTKNFNIWSNKINRYGSFSYFVNKQKFIFPVNFWDNASETLVKYNWNKHFKSDNKESFKGTWVIFNDIRYFRHRPPKTYKELFEVAEKNGLDKKSLFERIVKNVRYLGYEPIVLVGFPIPEKVGEFNNQIYWIPFKFKNKTEIKKVQNELNLNSKKLWRCYKLKQEFLPVMSPDDSIEWIKEENCSVERIFSRSSFSSDFQNKRIFLIGCGSLGSLLADLLIRGGIKDLILCDLEILEFGNLCRHTLSGDSLNKGKAYELEKKLSLISPICNIKTHIEKIPSKDKAFIEDILSSDLIIDCTSDKDGLIWLSSFCKKNNKQLCSLSFNSKATYLTVAISSSFEECFIIKNKIWNMVSKNETPFNSEDYYEKIDRTLLIQNAGCYHPTFPALYNNIQTLVSIFVGIFPSMLNDRSWGVVIHRKGFDITEVNSPFTVWKKEIS